VKHWTALALLSLTLFVTSCAVRAKQGGTEAEKATGFLGMKKADLNVETEKAFLGVNEVVIGSFKVGFVEEDKAARKAGGYGGKASATSKLVGVSRADMQALTDALYDDFLAQLRGNGYQVLDRAPLLADAKFKATKSFPAPFETDDAVAAMGADCVYFVPAALGSSALHLFASDGISVMSWSLNNPTVAATQYAEANKVKVLSVNYLVDFVNADGHGGRFTSTASVQVGQGISIKPSSGISLIGGQGGTFSKVNGAIRLGQPISSTETFAEIVDVTSTAHKSVEVASNVIGVLGGVGTNQSRDFEVRANPAQFQAIVTTVGKQANQTLVAAMAARR